MTRVYTKDTLIAALKAIRDRGWIPCKSRRRTNDGRIGNTLEDLLDIDENNLPLPNAAEWELKTHRSGSTSLVTLLHLEPSPQGMNLVGTLLLPKYGWRHAEAGKRYGEGELSFRQTIHGKSRSDRGFGVIIDEKTKKVLVSFAAGSVDPRHSEWLQTVRQRVGLGELRPQPYWGFNDLHHALGAKIHNCFYLEVATKRERKREFFYYRDIMMLSNFRFENLLEGIRTGFVFVDFDARTGHNHGTKFRMRSNYFPRLFGNSIVL